MESSSDGTGACSYNLPQRRGSISKCWDGRSAHFEGQRPPSLATDDDEFLPAPLNLSLKRYELLIGSGTSVTSSGDDII